MPATKTTYRIVDAILRLAVLATMVLAICAPVEERNIMEQGLTILFDASLLDTFSDARPGEGSVFSDGIREVLESLPAGTRCVMVPFTGESWPGRIGQSDWSLPSMDRFFTAHVARTLRAGGVEGRGKAGYPVLMFNSGAFRHSVSRTFMNEVFTGSSPPLYIYSSRRHDSPGVSIYRVEAPEMVTMKHPFQVHVTAWSDTTGDAGIRLVSPGIFDDEKSVTLRKGVNTFSFGVSVEEKGFYTFVAEVESGGDTITRDNRGYGWTVVSDRRKILYIEGTKGADRHFISRLRRWGWDVRAVTPPTRGSFDCSLEGISLVVLSNTDVSRFSKTFLERLRRSVGSKGTGFLMIGGEGSFGPGGYHRTPVEDILPVTCRPSPPGEEQRGAILFVLDKSGSMNRKVGRVLIWDIASSGVEKALALVSDRHLVGIMAADDAPHWISPPGRTFSKGASLEKLKRIGATGLGIYTYDAMREAYDAMSRLEDVSWKHIVFYADMADCEQKTDGTGESVLAIVDRGYRDGVSVSTIGLGSPESADRDFLMEIARRSGGRFYEVADPEKLPVIFMKEASRVVGDDIVEGSFDPVLVREASFMRSVVSSRRDNDFFPPLGGYVRTTPRGRGIVYLESPGGDPVLAGGRYGLGVTGAFTSGVTPRWGKDWLEWRKGGVFWDRFLSSLCTDVIDFDCVTELDDEFDAIHVAFSFYSRDGTSVDRGELTADVRDPDGTRCAQPLWPDGMNRYVMTFPVRGEGLYRIDVRDESGRILKTFGRSVAWTEYYPRQSLDILGSLARESGGELNPAIDAVASAVRTSPVPGRMNLRELFLWISLFLFFTSILLRKITNVL